MTPPSSESKIRMIHISKLKNDLWDARKKLLSERKKKDEEQRIDQLSKSIDRFGLWHPISITESNKKGFHSIIAGRRRFEAFKKLDNKDDGYIWCKILTEQDEVRKQKIITFSENATGKHLLEEERIAGIIEIFNEFGFGPDQIKHLAKSHHNNPNLETIPDTFKEGLKNVPYTSNTIYQLMQLITDLKPSIYKYAQENDLVTSKKIMLTHTKLRKHPQLQKELIHRIKFMRIEDARLEVDQMIQDIVTGAIKKDGNSYYYDESVREKLEVRPTKHYLNLMRQMHKMLFSLTGHKINRGEYRYFQETVTYSKDHRKAILEELNELAVITLDRDLRILKSAVDNMLELVEKRILSEAQNQAGGEQK